MKSIELWVSCDCVSLITWPCVNHGADRYELIITCMSTDSRWHIAQLCLLTLMNRKRLITLPLGLLQPCRTSYAILLTITFRLDSTLNVHHIFFNIIKLTLIIMYISIQISDLSPDFYTLHFMSKSMCTPNHYVCWAAHSWFIPDFLLEWAPVFSSVRLSTRFWSVAVGFVFIQPQQH